MIIADQMLLALGAGALEDAILVNHSLAFLLDGGTGIGDRIFAPDLSDARLFVYSLVDAVSRLGPCVGMSPKEVLRCAYDQACAKLRRLRPDLSNVDPGRMPIATAVLVRWLDDRFEGVVYGDVACMHELDGIRVIFHDRRVVEKDRDILNRFCELQRSGASAPERRAELVPLVLKDRLRNYFEQRYSTITLNPASIDTGIEFKIRDERRGRAVVASDGFLREADIFGGPSREAILAEALQGGLFGIAARVRALEAADPERVRGPRLKDRDDMAAAAVRCAI